MIEQAYAVPILEIRERLNLQYSSYLSVKISNQLKEKKHVCRNAQILDLVDILENEHLPYTLRTVGEIFSVSHGVIAHVLKGKNEEKKPPGNQRVLSDQDEEEILEYIYTMESKRKPCSLSQIIIFIQERFGKTVTSGYINCFYERHSEKLKKVVATPMDEKRVNISRDDIQKFCEKVTEEVKNVDPSLIFNADETGVQEFADSTKYHAIVSSQVKEDIYYYSVRRSQKLFTVLPCISLMGKSTIPLIITSRLTEDNDVSSLGMFPDKHYSLVHSEKGYVTRKIFYNWCEKIFIPFVYITREENNLPPFSKAIIFFDNCSSHKDQKIMDLLAEHNIKVLPFVPHTSHICQMLDLVTFSVFKGQINKFTPELKPYTQAFMINQILHAIQQATIPFNNVSAFRKAGIQTFDSKTVTFDPSKIMERFNEDNSTTIPIHFRAIPWNQTSGSTQKNQNDSPISQEIPIEKNSISKRKKPRTKLLPPL